MNIISKLQRCFFFCYYVEAYPLNLFRTTMIGSRDKVWIRMEVPGFVSAEPA
jgi:hypothetical protein